MLFATSNLPPLSAAFLLRHLDHLGDQAVAFRVGQA